MPTVEKITRQINRLPEALQQEVLDFVEFLQVKHRIEPTQPLDRPLLDLKGGLETSSTFADNEVTIQERLRVEWE